jgi:lipopolysaccharide export system permease protein
MNRLTRYVLLETLKVFVITLAGMTLLMMLVGLAQEAIQKGLGALPILRLVPFVLPNALRFAVPGTILFATCSVYGRMSADNEFVAVKSLGIPPMALLAPVLVLSFIISLVAVWLNDLAVTWGRHGIHRVVLESVEQIAYGMLRTQRSYSTRHLSINVKSVEGRRLKQVRLTMHQAADSPPIILVAREAELRADPAENRLSIIMTDGSIDVGDEVSVTFPDTIRHEIPLSDASRKSKDGSSPSECALWRIPVEEKRQREEILRLQQLMAARAAFQLCTGGFGQLSDKSWRGSENALEGAQSRLFRIQTEPWRRWANGFSCFFFVLVGAPLAIRLRNADLWTSFAVCFLPILIVYYPLLAYGVDRAKCGALPPYCVWLGNLILLGAGIWQLRKVMRY